MSLKKKYKKRNLITKGETKKAKEKTKGTYFERVEWCLTSLPLLVGHEPFVEKQKS